MRQPLLLLTAALAATAAGCGADDPPPAPRPLVALTITAPRDAGTTREPAVMLTGRVAPAAARVIVLGERVAVNAGEFSHSVSLREGTNVIDVGASAPGRRAVWRALRVTRRSKVEMPALVGQEEDAARTAVEALGLKARVVNYDDLFDAFRRRPRLVCNTNPEAGEQVDAGAQVTVVVSKTC